jgi:hypothetical protein
VTAEVPAAHLSAVVQLASALLYFWLTPGDFPYTVPRHSEELLTIGYVVMLATPVMLAMGYYILNQGLLPSSWLHTAADPGCSS